MARHEGRVAEAASALAEALDAEVSGLVAHGAAFRPGHLYCLRCGSAVCEHASPPDARSVFAGYGPTGQPRYLDLPQWLLERGDPRVDRLYSGGAKGLVAVISSGRELAKDLLPAFQDRQIDYRIHGQVATGWFKVPATRTESSVQLALTFQVVSSAATGGRRRLGLNVLGRGPGDTPLQVLLDRLPKVPWSALARATERTLADIEAAQDHPDSTPERLSARIEGVLQSIGRRLERDRRSESRRTQHAEKRHQQGSRPTAMAHADLSRADLESVLVDRRRDTLVVVGDRGRAHIFSRAGKLVTSIRVTPDSVARKQARRQWRPARADELDGLRDQVGVTQEAR